MFIYVIVNSETLKIYIGQHKGPDLGKYLSKKFYVANHGTSGTRSHLYASMRKHPRDSWSIHALVSGIESREELNELEKHFIQVLKVQHPDIGYNICDGGEGYTGPGYWLGKKRPGFSVPKRPGWKNRTAFKKGSIPWNAGKIGAQVGWNKNKKMRYKSEESKQRAARNLKRNNRIGWKFSEAQRAGLKRAHRFCSCPAHVKALFKTIAWG